VRPSFRRSGGQVAAAVLDGVIVYRFAVVGNDVSRHVLRHYLGDATLVSCDPEDPAESSDAITMSLAKALLLEHESVQNPAHLARMWEAGRRKREAGGWIGGQIPYGSMSDGHGGICHHANERRAIAIGRTMREWGATYACIGEYFIGSGMRLRKGQRLHPSVIKGVLDRAAANGDPRPEPLDNLAKTYMNLPLDPNEF
jgi:hypothetical protein